MQKTMYTQPIILPLNLDGTIYAIQDEKGATIGTGTREVCEFLLHILNKREPTPEQRLAKIVKENNKTPHVNIRSAITI